MDTTERITYTELALQAELEPVIRTVVFTQEEWDREFLAKADVDPLNHHKPWGIVSPQLVKGEWTTGVCASQMIKPLEGEDETRLSRWIEYWAFHSFLHLIMLNFASIGEFLTPAEQEERVEEVFRYQDPALHGYGGEIRMLNPSH